MANPIKLMKEAILLAEKNLENNQGGPFGAIIVKNGNIIAKGNNQVTSKNDPTAHAEMVAIRKACEKLETFQLIGCELYTSCEPCPMCLGAIYWARPDKIYYASSRKDAAFAGFDDDFIYKEIAIPLEERKIPMEQLLKNEAKIVFEKWLKKEDKIDY